VKVLRYYENRLALIGQAPLWFAARGRLRGHRRFYAHGYMREEINALRRACGE
jgi:hypothetical protein